MIVAKNLHATFLHLLERVHRAIYSRHSLHRVHRKRSLHSLMRLGNLVKE